MAEAPKEPAGQAPFAMRPEDALAFMQKMWNPFGVPIPGFPLPGTSSASGPAAAPPPLPFANPAMMFATLDPAEIERKIGELRIIEGWLQMSLGMMQMSIKTFELQKASLEAMRATQSAGSGDQTG